MASWFLSNSAFKTKLEEQKEAESVTQWCDIPIGKVFNIERIIEVKHTDNRNPETYYLLILQDTFLERTKTYAPRRLVRQLKEKCKPSERVFITCLGFGRYKDKHPINLFDLVYDDAGTEVNIFSDTA